MYDTAYRKVDNHFLKYYLSLHIRVLYYYFHALDHYFCYCFAKLVNM